MVTAEEKKALFAELDVLRKELSELRGKLNSIRNEKENHFRKKEELNKKISQLIGNVKTSKNERDSYTSVVRQEKMQRGEFNIHIRQKLDELKELKKQRDTALAKLNVKGDYNSIEREIKFLETKQETTVMSFDKEKKLMKEIKDLKKKAVEFKGVREISSKIKRLSKELDALRNQSDSMHSDIQHKAKESQEKHLTVVSTSTQIDALKKEEQETFNKFIEYKKQFNEINKIFKEKQAKFEEINAKVQEFRFEQEKVKKLSIQQQLRQKEEIVNEKLRTGKKLTTEDFLVIQSLDK